MITHNIFIILFLVFVERENVNPIKHKNATSNNQNASFNEN